MDAPIDLYYFPPSPPVRAVLLLARAIGVALNLKVVNILAGDQMKPEFLKMNPMHTIPTMDDNGFILWESRAIMIYLLDKYAPDDSLYPKDAKQKAVVNLMLFFDATVLFPRLVDYFLPMMTGAEDAPNMEKKAKLQETLKLLDTMLENSKYSAGNRMTVSDFGLIATISTVESVQVSITEYPNIVAWYELCKKEMEPFDYQRINVQGSSRITEVFKNIFN